MKNTLPFIALLLALSALAAIPRDAHADVQSRRALAERTLQLARVSDTLSLQEDTVRHRVEDNPAVTPERRRQMTDFILKAMDSQRELSAILQAVELQCDTPALQAFNDAYAQPVATKLNALALQAGDPREQENLKAFAAQLESAPPSPERMRMLLRLDELTDTSKITAENMWALTARMSRTQPDSDRYRQMEEKVRDQTRETVLLTMLFSLREASDDEIAAFVALHERPQVAKVASILTRETMNGVQNMLDRVIESVVLDTPKAVSP